MHPVDTPNGVEQIKKYNKANGKVRISGATHWGQLIFQVSSLLRIQSRFHSYNQFEELRPFLFQEFENINDKGKQFKRMYYHPKSRIFPFGDAIRNIHYEKNLSAAQDFRQRCLWIC